MCGGGFTEETHKCYDHSHNSGKFRGILCNRCNVLLGAVSDSRETLDNIIQYLINYEKTRKSIPAIKASA
jgi:hypothetical protein